MDRNLNWKGHIKALPSKISRAIGFSKHAKSLLNHDTLKTLYTGIVETHFRYSCSVWGNCDATEKKHLQKRHNRAAGILTNSHFDAVWESNSDPNIVGQRYIIIVYFLLDHL